MEEVYNPRGASSGGEMCVVIYRRGIEAARPKNEPVLLIAHLDKVAHVSLFLNTVWREFVPQVDTEYIESVIEDLPNRAHLDPEGLFRHLSSLHVGTLITAGERTLDSEGDLSSYVPAEFTKLS